MNKIIGAPRFATISAKLLPISTLSLVLCAYSQATLAEQTPTETSSSPLILTVGGKLHSGGWSGENKGNITNDIQSDSGSGIGLSVGLRKGAWFGVFNVQSGTYEFDDEQPVYDPDPIEEDDLEINSGFFSLGFGYQFNPYFALQGGIKSHGQSWKDYNREANYVGVGIGATGFIPLSDSWTLYGTLGLNSMNIEDKDGNDIGDGSSSSLELGAAYRISPVSSISFGFKNEAVVAEFDESGNEQEHNLGNFYFGYNHGFRF
ncbi:MAG: porin family protein [Agarilytica sp.]